VPGAAVDESKKPDRVSGANKNAKRRAARKKAKEKDDGEADDKNPAETKSSTALAEPSKSNEELEEEEKEKKAKAIRKKIRQANELKSKRENGESLLPEQIDKIIKMNELTRQLNALGFKE